MTMMWIPHYTLYLNLPYPTLPYTLTYHALGYSTCAIVRLAVVNVATVLHVVESITLMHTTTPFGNRSNTIYIYYIASPGVTIEVFSPPPYQQMYKTHG